VRIRGAGAEPKYTQTKALILEMILREDLAPGARLPTEKALTEEYGVSRNTLRQAIGELVAEGILTRSQGRGTFYNGIPSDTPQPTGLIGVIMPIARSYIFGEI
jgi:GntR family transcriptional regulator of arabinose operon